MKLKIRKKRLKSVQLIVDLFNLNHLDIRWIPLNTLLEILKQAQKSSSLVINTPTLISFFLLMMNYGNI
jgi:hypothetical protein